LKPSARAIGTAGIVTEYVFSPAPERSSSKAWAEAQRGAAIKPRAVRAAGSIILILIVWQEELDRLRVGRPVQD
jgi:hypothetical protein